MYLHYYWNARYKVNENDWCLWIYSLKYIQQILDIEQVSGLSPGGSLQTQLPRGPIECSFLFIGVGNGSGFKKTSVNRPFWNIENVLSPEGRCVAYPKGSILTSFLFNYRLGNDFDTFEKHLVNRPFWNLENVLSPEGRCVAYPKGSILTSFLFNYRLRNDFATFKKCLVNGPFEILKIFYPPKGDA